LALRAYANGALFGEAIGGSPPQVLALHGWGRRGRDFAASLDGLDAIAPDLPGFGATPAPDDVIGAAEYARSVEPLLDEFGRPPVIVAHSFGGRIAVCLAALRPDRVGPLVLTGVPLLRLGPVRRPSLGYRAIRALSRFGLVSSDRMETERQRRGSADYRASSGVMRQILVKVINESYEDQLRALRSPVHLVWGERDREVPAAVAEMARDLIIEAGGTVQLTVLHGMGHQLPIEAPEALRAAIDGALGE
jgi:pimeloyl-ACP methyl ester carboxylesterase